MPVGEEVQSQSMGEEVKSQWVKRSNGSGDEEAKSKAQALRFVLCCFSAKVL
jgi:hypothetical protein